MNKWRNSGMADIEKEAALILIIQYSTIENGYTHSDTNGQELFLVYTQNPSRTHTRELVGGYFL